MKDCIKAFFEDQMPGVDDDTLNSIYADYRTMATELYAELAAKRAEGAAFEVVDRLAHTLKGNALQVGDEPLFEAVQAWRAALKEGDKAQVESLWPQIGALVGAL